jgi:hypothetical protein
MAMSRTWSSGVAHSVGFARNSAGFLRTEDARVSRVGRAQTSESRTYEREGTLVLSRDSSLWKTLAACGLSAFLRENRGSTINTLESN